MPTAPRAACSVPRCPEYAIERGRCALHRRTTSERGYGTPHQRERVSAQPGARCEGCGCTSNLQRDHVDPTLRGAAREHPRNKRWLCRCPEHGCHDRIGVRGDRPGGRAADGLDMGGFLTPAPFRRVSRNLPGIA